MASRACDSCKRRKVKCNGTQPCGTCCVSDIACHYTVLPKQRGPKVSRRLLDSQSSPHSSNSTGTATHESHMESGSPASAPRQESPISQVIDQHISAVSWASPNSIVSSVPGAPGSLEQTSQALVVWQCLRSSIGSSLPHVHLRDIAERCIDLYIQYIFPTAPIIEELMLRESVLYYFGSDSPPVGYFTQDELQRISHLRAFASLTATCAAVAAVMPPVLLPYRNQILRPLLDASRNTLREYEDFDLENPDSSSLLVRMLQSTALQHATGKTGVAWQLCSQATTLAHRMRLYDEEAVKRDDPLETKLLRFRFWHLYVSDQAAIVLKNRAVVLHELFFDGNMTLAPEGEGDPTLLIHIDDRCPASFENRVIAGYHILRRIWSSAASLTLALKAYETHIAETRPEIPPRHPLELTQKFLDFTSLIDELPPWLQQLETFDFSEAAEAANFQKTCFQVQRSSIMLGYHCFRLTLLQEAIQRNLPEIIGLSNNELTLMMRKVDIIRDFLVELRKVPEICLKVQGEPIIERLRRVGSTLLEIIQNYNHVTIQTRSKAYLTELLDILSNLDSRAVDELNREDQRIRDE